MTIGDDCTHRCVSSLLPRYLQRQKGARLVNVKMQQQKAKTVNTEGDHRLLLSKVTDTVRAGECVTCSHTVQPHQRPQQGGPATSSAGSEYSFLCFDGNKQHLEF